MRQILGKYRYVSAVRLVKIMKKIAGYVEGMIFSLMVMNILLYATIGIDYEPR